MNEIINIIISELQGLNLFIMLSMGLYILIGWFISKFAKKTFFRLIWVVFGLYAIIQNAQTSDSILFDEDTLFGIGFILPHIKFVFEWLADMYDSFKRTTANIYYFIITVYFKIKKVVLWFYQTYKKIQGFLSKQKYDKTNKEKKQNNYYHEQQYSNSYEQDEKTNNRDNSYSKNNEEQNSSYSNNTYEDNSNHNPYGTKFEQFFSSDYYIILGVSRSDDKATIKKAYRKLVMKYHPDINSSDEMKKYTTICQMLNKAYEVLG